MKISKNKLKNRLIAGTAIVVGTVVLVGALAGWNPLEKWQLKMTNRLYDRNEPDERIMIVGIDEETINNEFFGRWGNWSRTHYQKLIENLEASGAKTIAFDLYLTQKSDGITESTLKNIISEDPTTTEYFKETAKYIGEVHPEDEALAETFAKYDNIIIGEDFNLTDKKYVIQTIPTLDAFQDKVITAPTVSYADIDEVTRRFAKELSDETTGDMVRNFSFSVAENYSGEIPTSLESALDSNGEMMINYAAPPYSFEMIPFENAYNGDFADTPVQDKIVLIGIVSERVEDHVVTPTSPNILMPGVEVHANAIQTILEENYLHDQSLGSQIGVIALLSLLLTAAVMFLGILPGVGVAAGAIALYHLSAGTFFDRGLIINLVYPTIALFVAYLATTLYKYIAESREKAQLKGAFSKYVNKEVVGKILDNPEMLKLGGEKRTITVFFSDIANFTNFSESVTPEQLVAQLNEYLDVMAGIIMGHHGTLDKFEGDAIMAFWGAPLDQSDHAILACQSALACRRALRDLHAKWQKEGKPLLNFRIGLATGEAIVGNMGSTKRFDYTAIGDIVNLGARLESANKFYGSHIMLSDATFALLGDAFELRRLDRLRVKGKDQPVDVYELLVESGQLKDDHKKIIDQFHQAIEYYRNQKFEEAERRFNEVLALAPNDGPAKAYAARCAQLKANPPAEGWDGTWTLESK